MSGRGALQRQVDVLERKIAMLEKHLGNLPVRWPTPRSSPLLVDHEDHEISTTVSEVGVPAVGHLHDVWKVVPNAEQSSAPGRNDAETKLAFSICDRDGHDEGFVWGREVAGDAHQYGWGQWRNIVGIEKKGSSKVNLLTWARWNNGMDGMDKKIGPIRFDDYEDDWDWADPFRPWILGKMIFDGYEWCPSFQESSPPPPLEVSTRYTATPVDKPVNHGDHCPVFRISPDRYVKLSKFNVVTATGGPGPTVNVHRVAACNRDDINGIWRHLAVLDWHTADIMGWHDNWLDTMWASGGVLGVGLMGTWIGTVNAWAVTVDTLLGALSGFHPTTAALYQAEQLALTVESQAETAVQAVLPYVVKCPLPQVNHPGDYHEDAMLECQQFAGP